MSNQQTAGRKRRLAEAFLKTAASVAFVALIFVAAGTLWWPKFWIFSALYIIAMSSLMIWLKRKDPGLLKERMSAAKKKDVKGWDKTLIKVYTVLLAMTYLVIPLDAVRFHWSHIPDVFQWLALAGLVASWAIVFWAFRANAFLSGFVRIQTDRGHTVCTTGPYQFIRHPVYLANIISFLCTPLFLGSLYSLIPAALMSAVFVLRTFMEDNTLQKELPGYADYAARTRWKLIPSVW